MMTILSLVTLGIWIWLLVARGCFWKTGPVLGNRTPIGTARVTVVIPARDEAEGIGRCLSSLLAQDYDGPFNIVLVDDNSTDGTSAIALGVAAGDSRLTILQGAPLPHGWSGKLWAVSQGLKHESVAQADYILLTDADIEHAPDHISLLVAKAEKDGLELVSEMVRLHCETLAERAFIPAFVFFFQLLYPFRWVCDPDHAMAAAAGGTMLVSRAALTRIDGVNRIRHNLIDDVALAREVKHGGHGIWLGHADKAESLRIYEDAGEIWRMVARTAYVQLNHSPLLLLGTCAGLLLTYLAPVALLLAGGWFSAIGLLVLLLMAYSFQPTLMRYKRSPWWGFALPGIALFYLAATVASAVRHHTGQGGGWKNRVYPDTPAA
jgi:hopene-associated glycosyltransferase HpnB